jgi:hypothetical protein
MKTEPVNHSLGPGVVSMLFLVICMARSMREGLELHDVWELDDPLPEGMTLDDVEARLRAARPPLPVVALFKLRSVIGRVLHLDRKDTAFRPLVAEPAKRVYRIENNLVTALAELAIVDRKLRLTTYVKAHNRTGKLYLLAIEPARRYVVYPTLIRWAGRVLSR